MDDVLKYLYRQCELAFEGHGWEIRLRPGILNTGDMEINVRVVDHLPDLPADQVLEHIWMARSLQPGGGWRRQFDSGIMDIKKRLKG